MKTFKEMLLEADRLDHKHDGSFESSKRVFVDSHLKDSEQNWLTKNNTHAVSATVDLNHEKKEAYLNRIDAHHKRKGYGRETLNHIHDQLKRNGFKKIKTYVERYNFDSHNLMKNAGYHRTEDHEHGSYYEKEL